jgi:hypothetical protein
VPIRWRRAIPSGGGVRVPQTDALFFSMHRNVSQVTDP